VQRSKIVRTCGALRSENAGMSSERRVRIPSTESLRFPEEGSSAQGKSGPKLRPKGVGDGQQVEIPVPPSSVLSDGVTQEDRVSAALECRVQAVRVRERQILFFINLSCDGEGIIVPKFLISHCLEKPLARSKAPVPQTNTGRRGENPKVSERTLVKELGKMTP
jgi:hypothetical protein